MSTSTAVDVVCVGELLWDSLPEGLFLGGAPFNVAAHLAALGVRSAIATRVGVDRLGEEAVRRADAAGVDTTLVQRDAELPTGFVRVEIGPEGDARYEILAPAAWDAFTATDVTHRRCAAARMLVFGTLAQRDERAREAIRRLCDLPLTRVLDVNLRPPHDDPEIVEESLRLANVVKCNEEELRRIDRWGGGGNDDIEPAARTLAERFGSDTVCVTRGAGGAALLHDSVWSEHRGFPVNLVDPVGAGDAFLAGLLHAMLQGQPAAAMLDQANLLGAFVASKRGAIPAHDASELERVAAGMSTADPHGHPLNPLARRAAPTDR